MVERTDCREGWNCSYVVCCSVLFTEASTRSSGTFVLKQVLFIEKKSYFCNHFIHFLNIIAAAADIAKK
jgi:hypothetical protein